MLTQVYEISTIEEAVAMSAIGIDHVGVLVGDGRFPRELPVTAAFDIGAVVSPPSKFSALFLNPDISLIVKWVGELKPTIVHLGASAELLSPKDVASLKRIFPGVIVMRSIPVFGEARNGSLLYAIDCWRHHGQQRAAGFNTWLLELIGSGPVLEGSGISWNCLSVRLLPRNAWARRVGRG